MMLMLGLQYTKISKNWIWICYCKRLALQHYYPAQSILLKF